MENILLNDKARDAFNLSNEKAASQNYSIDPLTLLTIIHVLLKITELIIKWYTNSEKAAQAVKKLSFIKKGFIWYYVRREEKNKKQAKIVYEAICETLVNSEVSDLESMIGFERKKESNNNE